MEAVAEIESDSKALGAVVQIDDGKIRAHLDEVVRATVEETLNALLDAEADHLCGARKYERTEGRKDTRAGSYERQLHTKAGEVSLQVPYLPGATDTTFLLMHSVQSRGIFISAFFTLRGCIFSL
jgi:hypothetical protein